MSLRLVQVAGSCWSWLTRTTKGVWNKVAAMTSSLITRARVKAQQAREQIVRSARRSWMLLSVLLTLARRFRWQLAVATTVGFAIGFVCYVGGREVASAVCGFAGFVGSLASDAFAKVRRLLRFRLANES
jgi:hypothetical protein